MDYQDLYRRAWEEQNKRDLRVNPKCGLLGPRSAPTAPTAPARVAEDYPEMDLFARSVNRLIRGGKTASEIGALLSASHQMVTAIKIKYGLPK
jgi:hypothetical protein